METRSRGSWSVVIATTMLAVGSSVASAQVGRIVATQGDPDPTVAGATIDDADIATVGAGGFIVYRTSSMVGTDPVRHVLADDGGVRQALFGENTLQSLGTIPTSFVVAGTLVAFTNEQGIYTWDGANGLRARVTIGQALPAGGTLNDIISTSANPNGQLAYLANSASTVAVFVDNAGAQTHILGRNQQVPGHAGWTISNITELALDEDGDVTVELTAFDTSPSPVFSTFILSGPPTSLTTVAAGPSLPGYARDVDLLGVTPSGLIGYLTKSADLSTDDVTSTIYLRTVSGPQPIVTRVDDATVDLGGGYSFRLADVSSGVTRRRVVEDPAGRLVFEGPIDHNGTGVDAIYAYGGGAWSLVIAADSPTLLSPASDVELTGAGTAGHVVFKAGNDVYSFTPGTGITRLAAAGAMVDVGGGRMKTALGVGTSQRAMADDGTIAYSVSWQDDDGSINRTIYSTGGSSAQTANFELTRAAATVDWFYDETYKGYATTFIFTVTNHGPAMASAVANIEADFSLDLVAWGCTLRMDGARVCPLGEPFAAGETRTLEVNGYAFMSPFTAIVDVEPVGLIDPDHSNNELPVEITYTPKPPDEGDGCTSGRPTGLLPCLAALGLVLVRRRRTR
ncbi:MAG: hypothetical protein SFX73_01780 [Kofleriaceae bacterium]|nr:hypothetical protein [Kofleriaceae bacterium]